MGRGQVTSVQNWLPCELGICACPTKQPLAHSLILMPRPYTPHNLSFLSTIKLLTHHTPHAPLISLPKPGGFVKLALWPPCHTGPLQKKNLPLKRDLRLSRVELAGTGVGSDVAEAAASTIEIQIAIQ